MTPGLICWYTIQILFHLTKGQFLKHKVKDKEHLKDEDQVKETNLERIFTKYNYIYVPTSQNAN